MISGLTGVMANEVDLEKNEVDTEENKESEAAAKESQRAVHAPCAARRP